MSYIKNSVYYVEYMGSGLVNELCSSARHESSAQVVGNVGTMHNFFHHQLNGNTCCEIIDCVP